ncbi:MAG: histidine kinase N-terminal 7TM domain-containing protein, partial [Ruminococcus sp.]
MTFSLPVFYVIFILLLLLCSVLAKRSFRQCHNAVGWLESSIIIPIFGNLIIIFSNTRWLILLGYYLYFYGIDLVLASLVNFTNQYCTGIGNGTQKPTPMYAIIGADAVQILLNLFFGHAFDVRMTGKEAGVFSHEFITHFGHTVHHVVNYFVLLCVTAIFIIAATKTPKIYRERYTVILASVIIIEILQLHFIFFPNAHDITVIGYGIMGLMIFYFVIIYRPLRLL